MNYYNTFILVADNCPVKSGVVPITKEGKARSIHAIQYELISQNPYELMQADILFMVFAERNSVAKDDANARKAFFEKSYTCLKASALPK